MKGKNLFHHLVPGLALETQVINNTNADGVTISEPWTLGRQIMFILNTITNGIVATGLTVKIEGQKRSDDNWEVIQDAAGNDLEFTQTKLDSGGELETNLYLPGTLDLDAVDNATYKAIRLQADNALADATTIGGTYIIGDMLRPVSRDVVDDLFYKQRYGTAGVPTS